MKFDGKSGRRPSAEARRYVYNVIATSIESDLRDDGGWLMGGLDEEVDRRRVTKAAKAVIKEMLRKGKS